MGDAQDRKRKSARISNGLKASAKSRQCPLCKRLGAVKKLKTELGFEKSCRWCDYFEEYIRKKFQ